LIEWREIAGFRDALALGYLGLDERIRSLANIEPRIVIRLRATSEV